MPAMTFGHESKHVEMVMLRCSEMGFIAQSQSWRNWDVVFCCEERHCNSTGATEQALPMVLVISAEVRSRIRQIFTVFVIFAENE